MAWGTIGSLVGVIIGAWLAARWQRNQWLLDNKKAEYREIQRLLSAFRWKLFDHTSLYEHKPFSNFSDNNEKFASMQSMMRAMQSAMDALAGSIFIRGHILKSGIISDFQEFYHSWESNDPPNWQKSNKRVAELQARLLRLAWRDLGLPGPFPIRDNSAPE